MLRILSREWAIVHTMKKNVTTTMLGDWLLLLVQDMLVGAHEAQRVLSGEIGWPENIDR